MTTTDDTTPEPYTPTDLDVETALVDFFTGDTIIHRYSTREAQAMVARWLAAHDARVQAQAWDAAVASLRYPDGSPVEVLSNGNPYRTTEEGSTP